MAEILHTPITVIHVLACTFLMLVVLIQPGKSGGLGALSGAGAQQVFGGRGAGNFLTKTTWATAGIFFATSMTLAYLSSSADESLQRKSKVASEKKSSSASTPAPATSGKK
jgi:preprotein translocase subunit SecG